jgi:hypothetical protein
MDDFMGQVDPRSEASGRQRAHPNRALEAPKNSLSLRHSGLGMVTFLVTRAIFDDF